MIEVVNISKSFSGKQVIQNISTVFEKGKTNLIIGQSGSGKTVLLKSLVGLHEIDEGEIKFDGRNYSKLKFRDKKNIRKEIGMVFQGGALFDSATILENVMYPLDMFSAMNRKEKIERARFCLNRVNLSNVEQLYPAEVSGGMQKRTAIARAIVLNPKYLFFDEPNSGLDPQTALVIDKLIKEITEEYGTTTVINTHDMNSVMEIGEKIIFIYQGEKAWEGTKHDIINNDCQELNDFIFASELFKKVKKNFSILSDDKRFMPDEKDK
ncbi:MAG: ATP-binding cassette domain-containing protein [Bacteroidia bacterium]|nr:ATP-binding cassette domain-containing protein [Bacteroidia bacterium]